MEFGDILDTKFVTLASGHTLKYILFKKDGIVKEDREVIGYNRDGSTYMEHMVVDVPVGIESYK